MKVFRVLRGLYNALIFLFMLLPLAVVIMTAFSGTEYITFPPKNLTLDWFSQALHNQLFLQSIGISLKIAALSTVFAVVLGTMASLYFWKRRGALKQISELVFMSPMIVPTVVTALGLLMFFTSISGFTAFWKLTVSYACIEIPYVIRSVTACLYGLDTSFEEASMVLGASPLKTLFKVTLPCAKRGIVGGTIFSFVIAFDEAVIIMFLKDSRTLTYPLRLYSEISQRFSPMVSAFATLFILLSFLIILFTEKYVGLSDMYK